ncbi:MAG: energy-coupled thiamine transporter ThiT [Anaeroplasmataceae bacterium]|nr:energy-coupled thiamine transporter ThiT [Anaeroplasmataceae bacterium]
MKREKFSTKVLAEVAIFAALAFALDALQGGIWRGVFFNGGSIGFAMVPIFIIGYRRGLLPGILCGLIVSLVQMLGGIYVINASSFENSFMRIMGPFIQIMLDYVLAYTVVGLSGVFARMYANGKSMKSKILWIIVGTACGSLLKYACHVVAGGVFWLSASVEDAASFMGVKSISWGYSFLYNGAYCIPNMLICSATMVVIARFYGQFLVPSTKANKEEAIDAVVQEVETHEEVEEK